MTNTKHIYNLFILLVLVLVIGCFSVSSALAAGLTPADKEYENGSIVLRKQAERIGADEWKVNVSATIKQLPVTPPQLDVVFVLDTSASMKGCTYEAFHEAYLDQGLCEHVHGETCPFENCNVWKSTHVSNGTCQIYAENYTTIPFTNRITIALDALRKMKDALPEGTRTSYVGFGTTARTIYNINNSISPQGETSLVRGLTEGFDNFEQNSNRTQILIIITDGEANRDINGQASTDISKLYSTDEFEKFKGQVYTIGFNHDDPNLKAMAKNGGTYFQASNADQLELAFSQITDKITAMLFDPMGTSVSFETNTSKLDSITNVAGSILYDNNTLLWTPTSSGAFSKDETSTISYNYEVKLNANANRTPGSHKGVELNDPTYLRYGLVVSGANQMKSAAFPIPEATYEISSMQVNWKCGNEDLMPSTETETIFSDWGEDPDFSTDYKAITQEIVKDGTTYYYTETVITRDGNEVNMVALTNPGAYVVTHHYTAEKPKYSVTYEYTGSVPTGAPAASSFNTESTAGNTITVAANPSVANWTFSGWSIAEGGATITDGQFTMPANNVKLVGRWTENAKKTVTVYFVDGNNNTLRDDITSGELYVGSSYNVSSAKEITSITVDGVIYDFVSDGNAAYEGTMPEGGLIINRVYAERAKATVTVNFVDDGGNILQTAIVTEAQYIGSNYNVTNTKETTSITTNGKIYDFVSDSNAEYTGTIPAGGVVINRVYAERAKARVAVHFHTDDDPPIALQGSIYSEPLYVGAEYDVTDTQIPSLSGSGKIYDFVYDNGVAYKGTMPERGAEIIRTYKRRSAPVTVHYVDKDGNALQAPTTSTVFVGDSYDVSDAAVATITTEDGKIYNFDSDDNAVYTGTMPDGGLTITRVYARSSATATVTVYYVKENGNALHTPTTSNVLIGDPYDVSAAAAVTTITVDGVIYDFLADGDAEYTGKMPNSNVTILRIYTERDKATVTINYYIIEDEEVPLQDAFSLTTYIDTDYAVPASAQPNTIVKDKIPYDFVSDDTDNTKTYSGKMPKGGVTINRLYKERGMAAVTVKFVDGDGLELRANISASQYIGNTYDASATKSFTTITTEDGKIYDFVSDGDAAYTGELTADGVTITRVYKERGTAEAIVKFVDENGNPLKESISDSQYIGNPYDVSSAKEISSIALGDATYTFVSDDNAEYTGEMPEEGLTITRVYKKVLYYYQVHYVYTGHDAGNQEFYTNTITTPVSSTTSAQYTFYTEATRSLDGMDFWLLGTQMRSGDLSSSTAEAPYVFEIHYEYHKPPVEPDLPETGDEGMGKWVALLAASIAGMVATIRSRRKASKCS